MYIELYDQSMNHLGNVDGVTYDLTRRVYDMDSFQAKGKINENVSNAKVLRLCDDSGQAEYACFVDYVTPDEKEIAIKGSDFRTILKSEFLIDYTSSFNGDLFELFTKAFSILFSGEDNYYNLIQVDYDINSSCKGIDTTSLLGDYSGTYMIKNIYEFIKPYLKVYEYYIETSLDVISSTPRITFKIKKTESHVAINIDDFTYTKTTTSISTNKTVATIKSEEIPRPSTIAKVTYYLTKSNEIVQSSTPSIANRIYPVVEKIFEDECLAKAQYNAVYELANGRYVDNVLIDVNTKIDPVDLENQELYTLIDLYQDGVFVYSIPITEKTIKMSNQGKSIKIKLGFKKILLTEIIKNS